MSEYIDRQEALNAINIEREYMTRRQEWGAEHILTHYGYRIIADMPSADVEPVRHGRWIDAEIQLESGGSMPIQACSLCKTFYPLAYTGGGHRFCPNCGAKMKGVDDE